jgi:hypothetical protein
VFVVEALPVPWSAVDAHLSQCYECREELASLAPLPALLHRVALADAERIMLASQPPADVTEPSPRMLDSLLDQVRARRRTRRFRGLLTAAAAVLIAAGGTAAVAEAIAPHHHQRVVETAIYQGTAQRHRPLRREQLARRRGSGGQRPGSGRR